MNKITSTNKSSVEALFTLLQDAYTNPNKYINDLELHNSLTSQGRLAKFNRPSIGVKSLSLNTFKSICDSEIIGGFQRIDKLRTELKLKITEESLIKKSESTNSSDASKKRAIHALNNKNQNLMFANISLLASLRQAISDISDISKTESKSVRERLAEESKERIMASLSFNKPPFDSLNFLKKFEN